MQQLFMKWKLRQVIYETQLHVHTGADLGYSY